jgi:hypothetical protein
VVWALDHGTPPRQLSVTDLDDRRELVERRLQRPHRVEHMVRLWPGADELDPECGNDPHGAARMTGAPGDGRPGLGDGGGANGGRL